jgi:hypothetical protein
VAEQARKSGALRWILIGCGGLAALAFLCMGGCFALAYWGANAMMKQVEPVGVAYLKGDPQIAEELGELTKVGGTFLGSNIQITNDTGAAQVLFEVEGRKGKARSCIVWMSRSGGTWKAEGYELTTAAGKVISGGRKIEVKSSGGSWDD